jgi:TraG-like protein, N-terminal region
MELTIHLYGYAYHMFNTLNAIAMLRNSTLYPAMINTAALMVGVFYAWKMAASRAEGEWRQYLLKVGGMIVVINALLLPKTSMNIKDHVEKHFWRVDNIPLAFALPIGTVEEVGHLLTIGFEQAFSSVDGRSAFNYYHHGTVFGARLSKEVLQAHVRHPEFVANMNSFIKRCVVLPAMIGHQFTKEELVATKDMWGLVSSRAGTFTRVPMIIGGTKQEPSPTCKQAVSYFDKAMKESALTDITAISIKLRAPGAGVEYNPSHLGMNEALKGQIEALYNDGTSVENILKHNMMINSLNQYRSGKYPTAKAQLQHEAGGLISGDMAERILTGLLTVIKNLIYGSFVFVVPLMLFAGGMQSYRGWVTVCLSLQLWPPLLSMLNMMIDTAYEPAHIVSYSSWSTAVKQMDSIASVAANLTLLIPFLAVYVTRMSEGGFLHLAGSIMATAQSAGGAAAAEQSSGGKQYDNQSIANRNRSNVNENKYDDSRQFVTGTNSGINSDGSMEKILPNGQMITTGGAGSTSSVGEASYHESEGVSTALHEGKHQEVQAMSSTSASLSTAQESLVSKEASALTTIAENTRIDKGYDIDTSTDEGKEVVKALNKIDTLSQDKNFTWQQHAESYLKTDVSPPVAGKIASFLGFTASVGGVVNASNDSNQSDSSTSQVSADLNTNDRNGVSTRTSDRSAYLESKGIDKTQQDSNRESYNETTRLEQTMSAHKDKIDGYNKALDHVQSHGSEFSKDVTQDVLNAYKNQYGTSDSTAAKEVLSGSNSAKQVFRQISGAKANEVLQQVTAGANFINSSDPVSTFGEQHKNEVNSKPGGEGGVVVTFAKENDMTDKTAVNKQIEDTGAELKNTHGKKLSEKKVTFTDARDSNQKEQEDRQENINVFDKDRIGNGITSKIIGGLGNIATLGNAGWGIGRNTSHSTQTIPEQISSLDGNQVVKPPSGAQNFSPEAARSLIQEFKPDNTKGVAATNDGQHVDASKKIKG